MGEPKILLCSTHNFVIVDNGKGDLSSRGSPGHRVTDCPTCQAAVDEAFGRYFLKAADA